MLVIHVPAVFVQMLVIQFTLDALALRSPALLPFVHLTTGRCRHNPSTAQLEQDGSDKFFHDLVLLVTLDTRPSWAVTLKRNKLKRFAHSLHTIRSPGSLPSFPRCSAPICILKKRNGPFRHDPSRLPSVFCIYTQRSPPLAYSATGYLLSLALYPCCPLMALSASACHGFCGCALCYRSRLVVLSCSPFGPFGPFVRTWVQFIRCRSHTGAVLPSLWLPCLPISLSHG